MRKNILLAVGGGILVLGLAFGVYLVTKQVFFSQEASVATGVAKVRISPGTKTVAVGESFPVEVLFSTGGETISTIAVQPEYNFSGATPPLVVDTIESSSRLAQSGNWVFPIKKSEIQGNKVVVQLSGIYVSTEGYASDEEVVLATLMMEAQSGGSISMGFEPGVSKITKKTNAEDVLLTPTSSGNYIVEGGAAPTPTTVATAPTPTPTTEVGGPNPTSTPTMTPTQAAGATATPTLSRTPTPTPTSSGTGGGNNLTATPTPIGQEETEATPTPSETLPVAGVDAPTIMMGGAGVLLVLVAVGVLVL